MQFKFGDYSIRAHELDGKLSLQATSDLGEVRLSSDDHRTGDFPNEICFYIETPKKKPKAKGIKRFRFGEYKFFLGINYKGELFLFHSAQLNVGRKIIEEKDTLTLSLLKEPSA